jgi:hypothetical protein
MFLFLLVVASILILSFRNCFFIPEMPTGFKSYTVQAITIYFVGTQLYMTAKNMLPGKRQALVLL